MCFFRWANVNHNVIENKKNDSIAPESIRCLFGRFYRGDLTGRQKQNPMQRPAESYTVESGIFSKNSCSFSSTNVIVIQGLLGFYVNRWRMCAESLIYYYTGKNMTELKQYFIAKIQQSTASSECYDNLIMANKAINHATFLYYSCLKA